MPSAAFADHFIRGASRRPVSVLLCLVLPMFFWISVSAAEKETLTSGEKSQIRQLRSRIRNLENRLDTIRQQAETVRKEQEELELGIELAEARVEEITILLSHSRDEIVRLKAEAAKLSEARKNCSRGARCWPSTCSLRRFSANPGRCS